MKSLVVIVVTLFVPCHCPVRVYAGLSLLNVPCDSNFFLHQTLPLFFSTLEMLPCQGHW